MHFFKILSLSFSKLLLCAFSSQLSFCNNLYNRSLETSKNLEVLLQQSANVYATDFFEPKDHLQLFKAIGTKIFQLPNQQLKCFHSVLFLSYQEENGKQKLLYKGKPIYSFSRSIYNSIKNYFIAGAIKNMLVLKVSTDKEF